MLRRVFLSAAFRALALAFATLAPVGRAAEAGAAGETAGAAGAKTPLSRFARVEIAPTKTSIYVGSVSMTMPLLTRRDGGFEAMYAAKVFPYFFSNETGRLRVEMSDAALRKLERGEAVEFTGHAVNAEGDERRVEGKATPADASRGKIKVRVFVSKKIELIFNTTYLFPEAEPGGAERAAK